MPRPASASAGLESRSPNHSNSLHHPKHLSLSATTYPQNPYIRQEYSAAPPAPVGAALRGHLTPSSDPKHDAETRATLQKPRGHRPLSAVAAGWTRPRLILLLGVALIIAAHTPRANNAVMKNERGGVLRAHRRFSYEAFFFSIACPRLAPTVVRPKASRRADILSRCESPSMVDRHALGF